MRSWIIAAVLTFAGFAAAQDARIITWEVPAEDLIERAQRQWADALVSKDMELLDAILDPSFHLMMADNAGLDPAPTFVSKALPIGPTGR